MYTVSLVALDAISAGFMIHPVKQAKSSALTPTKNIRGKLHIETNSAANGVALNSYWNPHHADSVGSSEQHNKLPGNLLTPVQAAGQFDLLATQSQSDHSETPTQSTSPESHEHAGRWNHLEPSEAQYSYEIPEEQLAVDASEEQTYIDSLQAQKNDEPHQKRRKYVEPPRKPCQHCGALVPCTNAAIRRHIRDNHPIIVDLNHVSTLDDLDATASNESLEDRKYFATLAEQEESNGEPHEKLFDEDENSGDEDEDCDGQDNIANEAARGSMDRNFKEQDTCLDSTYKTPTMGANPLDITEEKNMRSTIVSRIDGSTIKRITDIFGKVFNDRAAFASHIATDHMDSQYSNAAGRRVPKTEVLLTSLIGKLKNPLA